MQNYTSDNVSGNFPGAPELFVLEPCCEVIKIEGHGRSNTLRQPVCLTEQYALPAVPAELRVHRRFILSNSNTPPLGYWINVLVDNDIVLYMFGVTVQDIYDVLIKLCCVCNLPQTNCICDVFHIQNNTSWELYDKRGILQNPQKTLECISKHRNKYLVADMDFNDSFSDCNGHDELQGLISNYHSVLKDSNWDIVFKLTEDVITLQYQLKLCKTIPDMGVAIGAFLRSVTGQSLFTLTSKLLLLIQSEFGSLVTQADQPTVFEQLWENYATLKHSFMGDKVLKVFNHVVAHAVYHKMGIEVDSEKFALMEEGKLRPKMKDCISFMEVSAALIDFLLKQGRQYMLTGDINTFFVSSNSVGNWMTRCKRIKADFQFLSNPGAVQIKVHSYLEELRMCIEDGHGFAKALHKNSLEYRLAISSVIEMETLEKTHLCLAAAVNMRFQPLGIVVYGSPGVGKTRIMEYIQHFHALRFDLDPSKKFTFYHSSLEEYFTNFRSYQHTIVLDDVAQQKPSKVMGMDTSLDTIIKVFNNISLCPPQAAVDDKGKTPMLCELGLVSTNVLDMNIKHYYEKAYAVMRRLPIHIEPVVKPEYRVHNGLSIDPQRCGNELYEDCWDFIVRVAVQKDNMNGDYVEKYKFNSLKALFDYLGPEMDRHRENQKAMLSTNNTLRDVKLCGQCKLPVQMCDCVIVEHNPADSDAEEVQGLWEHCKEAYTKVADLIPSLGTDEPDRNFTPQEYGANNNFNSQDDIFGEQAIPTTEAPWRLHNIVRMGPSRPLTRDLAFKFLNHQAIRYHNDEFMRRGIGIYTSIHLPELMHLGCTNEVIFKDLTVFLGFYTTTNIYGGGRNDMLRLSEEQPSKAAEWASKIFVYFYFEIRFFKFMFNLFLTNSTLGAIMVWVMGNIYNSSKNRRQFMCRVGQTVDNTLMGQHPWVKAALAFSAGMMVYNIYTAYNMRKIPRDYQMPNSVENFEDHWQNEERKAAARTEEVKGMLHVVEEVKKIVEEQNSKKSPLAVKTKAAVDNVETIADRRGSSNLNINTELQGIRELGTFPIRADRDDMTNVWVTPERTVTTIDFRENRATNLEAMSKSLKRSCVIIDVISLTKDGPSVYTGRAIILGNSKLMTNMHALPKGHFMMRLYTHERKLSGVSSHVEFHVDKPQVTLYSDRDIAIISTFSIPPFHTNISLNFANDTFNGVFDGFYLVRQLDGTFERIDVHCIRRITICKRVGNFQFNTLAYRGVPSRPTEKGECGSPLFMDTGYGPILVGFHFLYDPESNTISATRVTYQDIEPFVDKTVIQCGVIDLRGYDFVKKEKSFLDFHDSGSITYHGEMNTKKVRCKTRVGRTEIADYLHSLPRDDLFIFEDRFSKPYMDSWRPQQKALIEYAHPANGLNEVVLAQCAKVFLDHIIENVPEAEMKLIHPYCLEVAINGAPGMAYVDGIKRSTSTGFPHYTTKRKFMEPLEDERFQDGVKLTPDMLASVERWLANYEKGVRNHPIFASNLKDEVVSLKKYLNFKTRVFFSCPEEFLIIVRMMFLGFTRVVQRNWRAFHCAVGINVHCVQWDQVHVELTRFGKDRMIAGDFVGFDKKFSIAFIRWVFWIIKQFLHKTGNFTEKDMLIIEAIEADLSTPTVDWFGMLITLLGGEVSGHQLTTIFNCFASNIYLMYAYALIYTIETFFKYVSIVALGDDHVVNVSIERPLFTHTHIKNVLEAVGVGYSMADKEAESVPFIHMSEVTFLKRQFVYNETLGAICGPLDKDSINKMITYQVSSKACSKSEQLAQALVSASMESFYHGREFFDYINRVIDEAPKSDSLIEHMKCFPRFTWEQNIERFWNSSRMFYEASSPGRNQKGLGIDSHCVMPTLSLQGMMRMDLTYKVARAFPEVHFYGKTELQFKRKTTGWWIELPTVPDKYRLANSNDDIDLKLNQTLNQPQLPERVEDADVEDTQRNTTFAHEASPAINDLSTYHDPTADSQLIQADLKSFLSRPAKIASYNWNIGTAAGPLASYSPWALYFNTPVVKNKLSNFKYIRCNLHVKFVINASPFYYGSVGAFYEPLSNDVGDRASGWAAYAAGQQVLFSQRNKVWLDPQTVSNQEMVLPFLYYYNFLDTVLLANFTNFGILQLVQYAGLQSANGVSSGGVTINMYAWASEVDLAGATAQPILQGKQMTAKSLLGEYAPNGQISSVASTVSGIAGALSMVPEIGPFAMATAEAAETIGGVASLFGYTNVPVVEDVKPYKPSAFHTLASSEISEPINKLSLQPKQETSVGAFHGDVGADPLVISNFIQRESFLCGSQWSTTNVEDDILFTSAVTPELYEFSTTPVNSWYPTPMAYMTNFFQYWTGDIIFRFKVIKSKYHRGRLNICWDVGTNSLGSMPVTGNPATFNIIVDLDEKDEVEVRVPYTQSLPFLGSTDLQTQTYWSNGLNPTASVAGNGVIQVRVLNNLTAPTSSSNVTLLVFVRGADNLEFAAPRNMVNDKTILQLQGDIICFNTTAPQDPDKFKEMFGERIVSLRELMHRQSKCASQVIPKTLDWSGVQMTATFPILRLPRPYGYSIQAWETAKGTITTATTYAFNFVRNHPVNWIVACFIGYKGSVNYNFDVINHNGNTNVANGYMGVQRRTDLYQTTLAPRTFSCGGTNVSSLDMRNLNTSSNQDFQGAGGMGLTNQYTNSGLAVNLPFYSRGKFLIYNGQYAYANNAPGENAFDVFEFSLKRGIATAGTTDNNVIIDFFHGTGPDFDVVYFLNCPAIFQCTPPTAV